ncbi:hypothetical protein C9374_002076 [Naegleria lovaniensis]|uniref:DNL-type domain-containing protein n=1 Tax=Naegleria lovaniensis TaxID=51637 RepID=A0AA88KN00_NAELO|nr:uncharacterized protein C9374_002076 [Naegleria lovaniensis]KAG2387041.1 hypothetical protein C9374_002076 [Naegleria lovaniensis]
MLHNTRTLKIVKPLTSFSKFALRNGNINSIYALSRIPSQHFHGNGLKTGVFNNSETRNYCSLHLWNDGLKLTTNPLSSKTSIQTLYLKNSNFITTKRYYSEEVVSFSKEEDVNDPLYVSEEEKRQKSEKMGMFYTCKPCKQRHYIEFSKHAYNKGVVITRCKNCQSLHLIADHLGWISDNKKSLEDMYGKIVKQSDLLKQQQSTEKNE